MRLDLELRNKINQGSKHTLHTHYKQVTFVYASIYKNTLEIVNMKYNKQFLRYKNNKYQEPKNILYVQTPLSNFMQMTECLCPL